MLINGGASLAIGGINKNNPTIIPIMIIKTLSGM